MINQDIELMAHLMRRAGFGASYEELERRAAQGYEATVEELLHPQDQPELKMDVMQRYMGWRDLGYLAGNQGYWTYRMVNSPRQLEEKLTLFWHSIFCTGDSKCMAPHNILAQLNKFRANGLDSFQKTFRPTQPLCTKKKAGKVSAIGWERVLSQTIVAFFYPSKTQGRSRRAST